MKIIYYKSVFCPRCLATNQLLERLRRDHPGIEIEERELLTHLSAALQDKVHTLPTFIIGAQRFDGAPRMQELLAALAPVQAPLPEGAGLHQA